MGKHILDVYYANRAEGLPIDPEVAAHQVFKYLERLAAFETIPWKEWFQEKPAELHATLKLLQKSPSYHTYSEHFLSGMPYWSEDILLSKENCTSLQSFSHLVNDSIWHELGKRTNGKLLINLLKQLEQMGFSNIIQHNSRAAQTAGIGLYTGYVELCVKSWRANKYISLLSDWCQRASRNEQHKTWRLFCARYPDAGIFLVYEILERKKQTSLSKTFVQNWFSLHPEQYEAIFAFRLLKHSALTVFHDNFSAIYDNDVSHKPDVAQQAESNSTIMFNLFPEINTAWEYLRTYMHVFKPGNEPVTLELPQGMEP